MCNVPFEINNKATYPRPLSNVGAVYLGCVLHAAVVYSRMISAFCRRSPLWYFKGIREAAITAFVTRSSLGTLPVTIANVRDNLGKFKRDKDGRQENNGMLKVLLFSIIAAFVVAAVTMLSINLPDPVKLGVRIGAFTAWTVLTWASLYAYRREKR